MILVESNDNGGQPGNAASHQTSVREKVRIRFRKGGPLRFVSHNDLMRCWDRMVRRAELPIRFTDGFNPKPRFSSPLSLGLGIIGEEEILELELTCHIDLEQVQQALAAEAPEGLTIGSIERHPAKKRAEVVAVEYTFHAPAGISDELLNERVNAILSAEHCQVLRTHPKKPTRDIDLRPLIESLTVQDGQVHIRVWVNNGKTARVDELIQLLELDQVDPSVVVTRSRVELAQD